MFNKETLARLIDHIDTINKMTEQRGFCNIRLFIPKVISEAGKLHFLVEVKGKEVSIFDKARLKMDIAELLNYKDIIIETEHGFTAEGKERIIGEQIAISETNEQVIKEFFNEKLIAQLSQDSISSLKFSS